MIGIFTDFEINADRFAVFIQIKAYFAPVERNRAIINSVFS